MTVNKTLTAVALIVSLATAPTFALAQSQGAKTGTGVTAGQSQAGAVGGVFGLSGAALVGAGVLAAAVVVGVVAATDDDDDDDRTDETSATTTQTN